MKKSMMWAGLVGIVGAMTLAGCQKHEDAAPATPEATTTQPAAPAAPEATPAAPAATTAPAATDATGNAALPSDQSDDMSNMNSSDAAKPATLPDSQSGTAEENR